MASINDMVQQYTEMRQDLKQLAIELGTQWQPEDVELDPEDKFLEIMTEHLQSADNRFEDLETLYINMDAKWKDVMVYYGENPKVMRPDDFFGAIAQFMISWKEASIAEEKYTQKLEREEKKKQDELERKKKLQAKKEKEVKEKQHPRITGIDISEGNIIADVIFFFIILQKKEGIIIKILALFYFYFYTIDATTGTDADRSMMDDLLAKLRVGDGDVRTRQKRSGKEKTRERRKDDSEEVTAEDLLKSLQTLNE